MAGNWILQPDRELPEDFSSTIGGHLLVAQTLARRGYTELEAARAFLDPELYNPTEAIELPGILDAAKRLEAAIRDQEKILVWGDFDVDGQTATTVLVSGLEGLGADVRYHIPIRAKESHGIKISVLENILDDEPGISVLLTCDTGISAHDAVAIANERGLDVLITDHHELPEQLPDAYAIVNPKLLPRSHALATLPGVGVGYKLIELLNERAGNPEQSSQYHDLVALGAIADVAELRGDTRYLVQKGIEILKSPERVGLQVMMEIAKLDPTWLTEEHIGFVIGPRLNAIGRLGDANPVVELLSTKDEGRARTLAQQLEGLNGERRLLTSQVYRGALALIEREPSLVEASVLVLDHPAWPAGVIGIVASRLVERYHKPAILISCPDGQLGRASARSVEGVDITAAIAAQAELLTGYGGHAMAAGFAIERENIPAFRRAISRFVAKIDLPEKGGLIVDAELPFSEISLDLVDDFERLAPFGAGNPPLVFASQNVKLAGWFPVGKTKEHLSIKIEDDLGEIRQALWWGGVDNTLEQELKNKEIDICYKLRPSTFRGSRDVQIEWVDYRVPEGEEGILEQLELDMVDYRRVNRPLSVMRDLGPDWQVWAEADAGKRLREAGLNDVLRGRIRGREVLEVGDKLVIWTTPPAGDVLLTVLDTVDPKKLILFAVDPQTDHEELFIKRLVGLVKYSMRQQGGRTSLTELSIAMAQRERTVKVGLQWLAAVGQITFVVEEDGGLHLTEGNGDSSFEDAVVLVTLRSLLEETRAYRKYYQRANVGQLLGKN